MTRAYDRVPESILCIKLVSTDRDPPVTIQWIHSWLSQRTLSLEMQGYASSVHSIQNGLPQGSLHSVIVFQVFMAEIPVDETGTVLCSWMILNYLLKERERFINPKGREWMALRAKPGR